MLENTKHFDLQYKMGETVNYTAQFGFMLKWKKNKQKNAEIRDLSHKFNMAMGKMDIWHINVYI